MGTLEIPNPGDMDHWNLEALSLEDVCDGVLPSTTASQGQFCSNMQ